MSSGTTVSQLFNQDKWERHRYVGRYFTNVATIGRSTVFRRIMTPCMCELETQDQTLVAQPLTHPI